MREHLLKVIVFLSFPYLAFCKDFIKPNNAHTYTPIEYSRLVSEDFQLRNGHGESVDHSLLKDKFVIVFITAKWCGPCKLYGNFIKKYLSKHEDKLSVVMISLDRSENDLKQYSSYYDNKFYYLDYSHREQSEIWKLTAKIKTRNKGSIPVIVMYDQNRKLIGFPRSHIQSDILFETREVKKPFNPWN